MTFIDILQDVVELVEHKGFTLMYVSSKPARLEAKVTFDREHISQKLIFTLMEITHFHGLACSKPHFSELNGEMSFLIGMCLPGQKLSNKYLNRMVDCLMDIRDFSQDFLRQLDFSYLDISMFSSEDLENLYPEHLTAIRDQLYGGSWETFQLAMEKESPKSVDIIQKCIEFEEVNDKDIGFVGQKLVDLLETLEEAKEIEN